MTNTSSNATVAGTAVKVWGDYPGCGRSMMLTLMPYKKKRVVY